MDAREAMRQAREDVAAHAVVLARDIPDDAEPDDLRMREAYLRVARLLDPLA